MKKFDSFCILLVLIFIRAVPLLQFFYEPNKKAVILGFIIYNILLTIAWKDKNFFE